MNAARTHIGLRTFFFIIVALLFAEGLTSSACDAAVASPEVRVGQTRRIPLLEADRRLIHQES